MDLQYISSNSSNSARKQSAVSRSRLLGHAGKLPDQVYPFQLLQPALTRERICEKKSYNDPMCDSNLKTNPKGSVSATRAIQKTSEEQVFVGKYFHPAQCGGTQVWTKPWWGILERRVWEKPGFP